MKMMLENESRYVTQMFALKKIKLCKNVLRERREKRCQLLSRGYKEFKDASQLHETSLTKKIHMNSRYPSEVYESQN